MGRRTWIKIFSEKWLRGTLREECAATRGIWADVLAMAGDSAYGDYGIIKLAQNVGYTDEQIAVMLHIPDKEWETAKNRLLETGRIRVTGHNVIHICKWKEYQSEYNRQKKHRNKE